LGRIRAKLDELSAKETAIEMQFSLGDAWSRLLFLALCRRYGLEPYRRYRQRYTTVMVRAPSRFINEVLWPEFKELSAELEKYLREVTLRVIREEVHADASEAPEVGPGLPAP
jgi:hypothetical protein